MSIEIIQEVNILPPQQHMKPTENSPVRETKITSNGNASVGSPIETDSAKTVEEIKTSSVLNYIVQRMLHLQDFINSFTERCGGCPSFPLIHRYNNWGSN